jgi:arginyl-tRNA synthetase
LANDKGKLVVSLAKLQELLRDQVRAAAREVFGIAVEQVSSEIPPRTELGDIAFPIAFELAKLIKAQTGEKRPPRAIAEQLRDALLSTPNISRIEIAGAGYLNIYFDRAVMLANLALQTESTSVSDSVHDAERAKRMVEHTSINPNKAAHIGHVRNAVLGDTFVRILRASGERVEVQNYIDNTGVQVADVVVGFTQIEHLTLDEIRKLDAGLPKNQPFDYYCWDLYTRVGLFYRNDDPAGEMNADRLKLRADTLHAIEVGGNATAELADYVATRNVECILDTMERLGIRYDVLPRESEILHLHFWDAAFERMKETGVIHLQQDGRNKGCWVMPFETHTGTEEHEADKIIVRSNGTVTYTGKDIAYQLWKLGRLGLDFNYRLFRTYPDEQKSWITTAETESNGGVQSVRPHFGGGSVVYNVIDARQSYTQDVVRSGVAAVAPDVGEHASVHLAYEMVALSPAACEELGLKLSEEDRTRSHIEMSGRKGLGVKADDLITRLEMNAMAEVKTRHPDLSDDEQQKTAHAIAVGALRYFLLKFTRTTVIAFDFKEALSFEGETGPYCQYAAVRANSIFRKLDASAQNSARTIIEKAVDKGSPVAQEIKELLTGDDGDEIWSMALLAARLDEAVSQAAAQTEPSTLAKYTFNLARAFNLFYHRHRILAEENETRRAVLVSVTDIARRQLTRALNMLGIDVPERM